MYNTNTKQYFRKILGIKIDTKLSFKDHIRSVCNKSKLNALNRLSGYMNLDTRRLNTFFSSQFTYCPLTWIFLNRELNHTMIMIRLHERCLRVVYHNTTSSFEESLKKQCCLNSLQKYTSLGHRNVQVISPKVISPKIMMEVFPLSHH